MMEKDEIRLEKTPDWVGWRDSAQTKRFIQYLEQTVREHQEAWLARAYESDEPHIWNRNNAAAIGYANAYRELVTLLTDLPEPEKKEGKDEK